MSTCKICAKTLKSSDESKYFASHLNSNKCLKVTNDLWYERDLLLQKIQAGDTSEKTVEEHKELDELYISYVKYKRYKRAKGLGLTGIPDDWKC